MQNRSLARDIHDGLFVQQCGWQACEPNHEYGPAVRDFYLIHFVASGQGLYYTPDATYPVGPGQGFIIFPGQLTTYRADKAHPWTYAWVGYAGIGAEVLTRQVGLTRESPVFTCPAPQALWEILRRMREEVSQMRLGDLAALGNLYQFLAIVGQSLPQADPNLHQEYCRKAQWFMEGNYHRAITIEDVAAFVGLSRSQLFRVFQRVVGQSPKAYLSALRMRRARLLLRDTSLTADAIAASVGLSSPARLGVLFRQTYGMSLSQFRQFRDEDASV